jgi:hypothetical protein
LTHGRCAVTHHQRRFTACGGDHSVTDHQQTIIAARQKTLDHDVVTVFERGVVCLNDFFAGTDVDHHAFALVAIAWFDYHW